MEKRLQSEGTPMTVVTRLVRMRPKMEQRGGTEAHRCDSPGAAGELTSGLLY